MESLVVAFIVASGCRLTGLALNNLMASNAAFVPVAYLLPIGAMVFSLFVIRAADRQRSGLAVVDKIVEAFTPAALWMRSLFKRREPGSAAS